jgi:hypothetical protein
MIVADTTQPQAGNTGPVILQAAERAFNLRNLNF